MIPRLSDWGGYPKYFFFGVAIPSMTWTGRLAIHDVPSSVMDHGTRSMSIVHGTMDEYHSF